MTSLAAAALDRLDARLALFAHQLGRGDAEHAELLLDACEAALAEAVADGAEAAPLVTRLQALTTRAAAARDRCLAELRALEGGPGRMAPAAPLLLDRRG